MTTTSTFSTLAEIKRANRDAGGHWFDPDTMRFFDTDLTHSDVIYGGNWFVHSNTFHPSDGSPSTTYWKVAHAHPDGSINDADSGDPDASSEDDLHDGIGFLTRQGAERYALDLEAGRVSCGCAECKYG